jgi:coenzyme F420-reducing hydrogenase beta subunit
MRSPDHAFSRHDIVRSGLCIGCGGCVSQARSEQARMRFDAYGQFKPAGPRGWLRAPDARLARTCPFSPTAANEDELASRRFAAAPNVDHRIGRFQAAYVGHAVEEDFRAAGSSGGLVSWTAAELMRRGLVDAVAHIQAADPEQSDGRLFRYQISRSEAALRTGAKSRYYPIELSEVLAEIRSTPGRYAVIGIPCFIKAIHLLRAEEAVLRERVVFTLGLFCGHMKSARMVESFARQMGVSGDAVAAIDFRHKDPDRPANWYTASVKLRGGGERRGAWWNFVDGDWGAGYFQNSACNFCDDVVAETADIAFGDAWVEPYASDGRGTNVVIVRSAALDELIGAAIEEGRLSLAKVDADFVHETQAAGFRQRREGLALRLASRRRGLIPRKRVAPLGPALTMRRWTVYRLRELIAAWSHRIFYLSRTLGWPDLYIRWAGASLAVYQVFAWSRGRIGAALDQFEIAAAKIGASSRRLPATVARRGEASGPH